MSRTNRASGIRLGVATLCALITLVAPVGFPRAGGPVWFDHPVISWVQSQWHSVNRIVLLPSEIVVWVPLIICGAVYFTMRDHSVRRAATLLVGPTLTVVSTEMVLKPLVGRQLYSPYVHHRFFDYPSGSAVALLSTVVAWAVVVRTPAARAFVVVIGLACLAGVAVALIWYDYHYPTDIVAAAFWSITVVFTVDALTQYRSTSTGCRRKSPRNP